MADNARNVERYAGVLAAAGQTVLVAGEVGYSIVVIAAYAVAAAGQTVAWGSGGVNWMTSYFANVIPHVLPESNVGWAKTLDGGNLTATLTNNVNTSIAVVYRKVPSHQEY